MMIAVIPAKDEEQRIAEVIRACLKHVDTVIVCDDGSTDGTSRAAIEAGAAILTHPMNLGYGASLRDLFIEASQYHPDVIVQLDGDGQHDAEEIPLLLAAMKDADVAAGYRKSDVPRGRKLGQSVLDKVAGAPSPDSQCGFRAYKADRILGLLPTEMGMAAGSEILRLASEKEMKIAWVPVTVRYDDAKHSQNMAVHGLDVLLSSIKQKTIRHPLVYYGIPGLALLVSSLLFFLLTLYLYGSQGHIAVSVELLAIALGLMGELLVGIGLIIWVMVSVVRQR